MSFEEPTQRLNVRPDDSARTEAARTDSAQTTTALPRPLDLAGPTPTPMPTSELSLDEIFQTPDSAVAPRPSVDEAPTWTAMPVVSVRSEPAVAAPTPLPPAEKPSGPALGDRIRTDAAAAWDGAWRRTREWLSRDDNGLMLMTALVACVLLLVVAAVG